MNKIKRTRADAAFDAVNIALLAILTVILFYPLYFVLIASVSDPYAIAQGSVKLFPVRPTLEAYQNIMKDARIWLGYRNTIVYTVLGTLLSLALTIPSAYVLSKEFGSFFRNGNNSAVLAVHPAIDGAKIPFAAATVSGIVFGSKEYGFAARN